MEQSSNPNREALVRLQQMLAVPPAQRGKDAYNPLEKIEELLTCPICLDRYRNPKLLPCQHTFCAEPCLDGLVDIVRRVVKCPECRAEHSMPYDGVKAFQTNYTLVGFLEIHLQASEDNAAEIEAYIRRYNMERCKVCDEKAEVEYCSHCDKRICMDCKTSHMELIKRDLGRLMNQIKRLSSRITEASDGLSKGMESLTMNSDHAKAEVTDYVRRYVKELKKKEERLVSDIDTFHSTEIRLMRSLRDALELESSNVNEACARVEAFLKGEREINEQDLVFYKQMFVDGLDYLRGFHPDADDLFSKKIRFSPGQDPNAVPAAILQFGELQVCAPQFGGRWQQLEAAYVPRVFNVGLESDRYRVKNTPFDVNDTSSWHNDHSNGSSRRRGEFGRQQQKHGAEENEASIRYRRRQQLEEEAWNRLRADRPGSGEHARRSPASRTRHSSPSPNPTGVMTSGSDVAPGESEPASRHVQRSPFVQISNEPTQPTETTDTTTTVRDDATTVMDSGEQIAPEATATSSASLDVTVVEPPANKQSAGNKPIVVDKLMIQATLVSEGSSLSHGATTKKPPLPRQNDSQEDSKLNEKIDNIRREHEKNMIKRKYDIPESTEKLKEHSAVDAGESSSSGASSSEQPVPVQLYSGMSTGTAHRRDLTDRASSVTKTPQRSHVQQDITLDWKKYLIPEPTTRNFGGNSQHDGHSATPYRESTPTDDWNERRKRFIRSKTNPEMIVNAIVSRVTGTDTANTGVTAADYSSGGPYRSRYLNEQLAAHNSTYTPSPAMTTSETRRSRFSIAREDSNESSMDADSNGGRTGSDRRTRYRRKADRSQTTLYGVEPSDLPTPAGRYGSGTPVANAAVGDSYRQTAKIDYKQKGRSSIKFGAKGAGEAEFNWPRGIAFTTAGEIVVCDSSNHRVQVFSKRGQFLRQFGKYGSGKGEFDCLAGIASTRYGQLVITDRYNHRVQVFEAENGLFIREFGQHGQTNGRFNNPWGVVVDQQGFIYVCDKDNHRVQIFQADGNFVGKFGTIGSRDGQFQNPHFIAVNKHNQLIVTDSSNHRLQVFDHNGHFLYSFGSEGFHDGQFKYPRGVAVDDQGFIVVADSGNNRIQVFYPDGRFYASFGSWGSGDTQLKGVEAVAINNADAKVIVSDRENHRLQIF